MGFKVGSEIQQRFLVRGAAHPNDETVSAVPRNLAIFPELRYLIFNHLIPEENTVRVELVGLDFPQYAHADLTGIGGTGGRQSCPAGFDSSLGFRSVMAARGALFDPRTAPASSG